MTTQELAQKILDEHIRVLQAVQGLDDFNAVHQYVCTMRAIGKEWEINTMDDDLAKILKINAHIQHVGDIFLDGKKVLCVSLDHTCALEDNSDQGDTMLTDNQLESLVAQVILGTMSDEYKEGDRVEITATGIVDTVYGNGRYLVRVHGEIVPMMVSQIKKVSEIEE